MKIMSSSKEKDIHEIEIFYKGCVNNTSNNFISAHTETELCYYRLTY